MTHTRERPFNCTVCTKSFIQAGNLNIHFRVHSEEKPHSCSLCTRLEDIAEQMMPDKEKRSDGVLEQQEGILQIIDRLEDIAEQMLQG